MTKAELIEALQDYPDDMEVVIGGSSDTNSTNKFSPALPIVSIGCMVTLTVLDERGAKIKVLHLS